MEKTPCIHNDLGRFSVLRSNSNFRKLSFLVSLFRRYDIKIHGFDKNRIFFFEEKEIHGQ